MCLTLMTLRYSFHSSHTYIYIVHVQAVDEFFSSKGSQRQDLKALQVVKTISGDVLSILLVHCWFVFTSLKQRTAVKKLENVRKDHQKRIDELQRKQVK